MSPCFIWMKTFTITSTIFSVMSQMSQCLHSWSFHVKLSPISHVEKKWRVGKPVWWNERSFQPLSQPGWQWSSILLRLSLSAVTLKSRILQMHKYAFLGEDSISNTMWSFCLWISRLNKIKYHYQHYSRICDAPPFPYTTHLVQLLTWFNFSLGENLKNNLSFCLSLSGTLSV